MARTATEPVRRFFPCCPDPPAPRSFPTRRSSDLRAVLAGQAALALALASLSPVTLLAYIRGIGHRSEEHTSELQSRFDLVCRLLLEKKKDQMRRRLMQTLLDELQELTEGVPIGTD